MSYWDNAGNQNNIGSITAGGNITAPNFVGNLSGNANSATYATTAGSANTVAWTNISGKPDFTAGRAYPRRADGADMNFNYIGQPGQPTWLWGSTDGNNMYVWNPSNFSVNYANTAG